jgi:hypothetical protein
MPRTCVDSPHDIALHCVTAGIIRQDAGGESSGTPPEQIMGATVPSSDRQSVAELHARAAHARRLARYIEPHEASRRLRDYADELEARAEAIEAEGDS